MSTMPEYCFTVSNMIDDLKECKSRFKGWDDYVCIELRYDINWHSGVIFGKAFDACRNYEDVRIDNANSLDAYLGQALYQDPLTFVRSSHPIRKVHNCYREQWIDIMVQWLENNTKMDQEFDDELALAMMKASLDSLVEYVKEVYHE